MNLSSVGKRNSPRITEEEGVNRIYLELVTSAEVKGKRHSCMLISLIAGCNSLSYNTWVWKKTFLKETEFCEAREKTHSCSKLHRMQLPSRSCLTQM